MYIYVGYLKKIHFSMMSELNVTNANIVIDCDITITNEIFLPEVYQRFEVKFIMIGNRSMHTVIKNNTFKNLYLHLDDIIGSLNITQNIFRGSGINITAAEDTRISLENNQFLGDYQRPVLFFSNTHFISLTKNYFNDIKVSNGYIKEDGLSSAIIGFNSSIELFHSLFKHVTLETMISLDNCYMEMTNTSILENTLSSSYGQQIAINMINSRGSFSNMLFANNEDITCIDIRNTELEVINVTFNRNKMNEKSDATMINVGDKSEVLIRDITVTKNKGMLIMLGDSSVNSSSATVQENSAHGALVSATGSYMKFDNLLFEGNFKQSALGFLPPIKVSKENPLQVITVWKETQLQL